MKKFSKATITLGHDQVLEAIRAAVVADGWVCDHIWLKCDRNSVNSFEAEVDVTVPGDSEGGPWSGDADPVEVVPGVFVDPGESVTVSDGQGEVAHWTADEWAEDGDAVTATVCAAVLAAVKGPQAVRRNIDLGGVELTILIRETLQRTRIVPFSKGDPIACTPYCNVCEMYHFPDSCPGRHARKEGTT